jgi:hypothetical protein
VKRDTVDKVIVIVIVVVVMAAFFAGVTWLSAHIPCSWYQFSKASDVPARCLTNFKH